MYLWNYFLDNSKKHGHRIALTQGTQNQTYEELREKSLQLADELKKFHIGEGSLIACYTGNNTAFVVTFLATSSLGAVFLPLDQNEKDSEIEKILINFEQNYHLVTTGSTKKLHFETSSKILLDTAGLTLKNELYPRAAYPYLRSIGMIQFSSGSTGTPKGILLSHEAIYYRAYNLGKSLGLNEYDKTLCSIPLSHSHGIDCLVLPTLLYGGQLYLYPPELAAPTSILKFIENEAITFFSSVPSFYEISLKLIKNQHYDLSSLRLPFCGSAALSQATAENFFAKFGVSIKQGYGLAEIGVICLNMHTDGDDFAYSSIGRPIEGISHYLVDNELVVTSKAMYSGYLQERKPAETQLYTGDLVQLDSKERFYIIGRKKDFINVSGQKVFPLEVEALIKKNDQIKDCVVTGENVPILGEQVVVYIELLEDQIDFKKIVLEIKTYLAQVISFYKIPKIFYHYQKFPRSPLGKILKVRLRSEDVLSSSD